VSFNSLKVKFCVCKAVRKVSLSDII